MKASCMKRILMFMPILFLHIAVGQMPSSHHSFNGLYSLENLPYIVFPIGGIGAGMFCIEGTGTISHLSVRNSLNLFNEPPFFAALSIKGQPEKARVLEGPIPGWKYFGHRDAGQGDHNTNWGLARFKNCTFWLVFPSARLTWRTLNCRSKPKLRVGALLFPPIRTIPAYLWEHWNINSKTQAMGLWTIYFPLIPLLSATFRKFCA